MMISGDAGTGKSFLFNTIQHAAKHIFREEGDFFDQLRVLSLAPSKASPKIAIILYNLFVGGVAAIIIEGSHYAILIHYMIF